MPNTSCVSGPSVIWKRGSAFGSVESITSNRPSRRCASSEAGKDTRTRVPVDCVAPGDTRMASPATAIATHRPTERRRIRETDSVTAATSSAECSSQGRPDAQYSAVTMTSDTAPTTLGLATVIYQVPDLDRAKAWYAQAFGQAPYFDQPFYVGFEIGGYELGLHPDLTEGAARARWQRRLLACVAHRDGRRALRRVRRHAGVARHRRRRGDQGREGGRSVRQRHRPHREPAFQRGRNPPCADLSLIAVGQGMPSTNASAEPSLKRIERRAPQRGAPTFETASPRRMRPLVTTFA